MGATMKKMLTIILILGLALGLALPAWAIEKEKKGSRMKEERKPQVSEPAEKKGETPVEIAPPREERQPEPRKAEQPAEERKIEEPKAVEREKIKAPPLERRLIEQIDRFVDKNGNGIDDRLEGREKVAEKVKPAEKKKKR